MSSGLNNLAAKLTWFSLSRRIGVFMLFVTILVVGFIAALGIPMELFPRGYESPFLYVSVPWQNAPTQEVMDKITLPLEEELSTVRGLNGINSYSRIGRASVYMDFKQGVDMDVAYREVRDRVERARALFPSDADRVFVRKEDPSGMPISFIGILVGPTVTDSYTLIEKEVVLPLSRIDGVASVSKEGLEEKEILIEIDKEKADANGLNLFEMSRDLRGDNFTMASGHVRDADHKFLLRSIATYQSIEEIENRLVTSTARVRDVATVKYEEPDKRFSMRANGMPVVGLGVMKEGSANTVEVCRELKKTVEQLKQNPRLAGLELEVFFNQGEMVEKSISNLVSAGRIGGGFAGLVLFVFLRRFRLTGIITLSIPLCLIIALTVMYFAGQTLNIITILGLVICVGLLVDNSVVVAENIHRHYQDGLDRSQACLKGVGEIALAITMATLTTVIVFLPVSLVEGQAQFFLIRLALPISVALVASLGVALIFIPLCVHLTLPSNRDRKVVSKLGGFHLWLNAKMRYGYDLVFQRLNHLYNSGLAYFLKRRLDLVILVSVLFGVTQAFVFKELDLAETQEEDRVRFYIGVDLPNNEYNFEKAKEYFQNVEDIALGMKDELNIRGFFVMYRSTYGRIEGWLDDTIEDRMNAKEVAKKIAEALPERAGVKLHYDRESRHKDDRGKTVFSVRIQGDDANLLSQIGESLEPILLAVPGVIGIRLGEEESTPSELALVLNRDRMNASEVSPDVVAGVVGYALRGQQLTRFNYEGREIPVRIRYEEEDRKSLAQLNNFAVPTTSGDFVSLGALAESKMLTTPRGIFRRQKKITHSITLDLEPKRAEETREALLAIQKNMDLPEGVSFDTSSYRYVSEDLKNLQFAAMLSVIFIYLLMGFLFESFVLPLSIILTIPLASIGVGWIHFLAGKDLDFLGLIGGILLIGVVVNNGIVLIDYVSRQRREGMERSAALLRAADRRFRPIVMTALTTIIGMIPLTVSPPSDMGLSYKSFGLTLIGGMTIATLLTLLVVPVFYTLFDDARTFASRAVSGLLFENRVRVENSHSSPAR